MALPVELRRYQSEDTAAILHLFYETVHSVNAADYTPRQLEAWAPAGQDLARWERSLAAHDTVVAEIGGKLVGFADLDGEGTFDRLFVHKDHQRAGIATLLANEMERIALRRGFTRIVTEASITARPFFERRGYRVEREQQVVRAGVALRNYRMEKKLG